TLLVNQWLGFGTQVRLVGGIVENAIERGQTGTLMAIFSCGYLAVSCVFLLLFRRALAKKAELELNALGLFETRVSSGAALINASISLISLIILCPEQCGAAALPALSIRLCWRPGSRSSIPSWDAEGAGSAPRPRLRPDDARSLNACSDRLQ